MSKTTLNIIISGGGTGGHIFPAISIADALMRRDSSCKILFVGAKGRMEMDRVPQAGYEIIGLPVTGFKRQFTLKNITFFFKLLISMIKAGSIVRRFKPDVAVGVGGYASGPVLRVASSKGIPIVIQEQNSYPGITNRLLAGRSSAICVAYPGMEKFFPADRIIFTGNPVRNNLLEFNDKEKAYSFFGLQADKKTILVIGGSLGAANINKGILQNLNLLEDRDIQVIWQTGKSYFHDIEEELKKWKLTNLKFFPFLQEIDYAFKVADVVVSRAGAGTISELALLGKASILVPSPNVAEDHQTKNAMALVEKDAALLIKDSEAPEVLLSAALKLLDDEDKISNLKKNILEFARPNAGDNIAEEIFRLAKLKHK